MQTLLVTGGAGFIGGNFVLRAVAGGHRVVTLDKLTYAGNEATLSEIAGSCRHEFVLGDIGDRPLVSALLARTQPTAVLNFAAETHVDRSIDGPAEFIQTNVVGTLSLLESVQAYWKALPDPLARSFRFLHVSTDEVYGSLGAKGRFSEETPYAPNSPYAASKASSDHLVRAFHETYGLPTLTTNCSNNYGPFQFPEKLIPLVIQKLLLGEAVPVYGDGLNVRDWLYVGDHCEAIEAVLAGGRPGRTYNVGGDAERTNIDLVRRICELMDARRPRPDGRPHAESITFVRDRPGHDRRYAIDATRLRTELGWSPRHTFEDALTETVNWYLARQDWVASILDGSYRLQRLGA
jgi:dTDP-glucose 4,6-dehydratase